MSVGNSASGIQIYVHLNVPEFGAGCIFLVLFHPLQKKQLRKKSVFIQIEISSVILFSCADIMYYRCHILIASLLYHLSHIFHVSSHVYLTLLRFIHTISYWSPLCFFHSAESFLQIFLLLNLRRVTLV